MRWLGNLWFRIVAVVRARSMERDLEQEFAFHVAMETDKLMGQGLSPAEAAAEAARRFGGNVRPRQEARDSWGVGVVRDFLVDLRHAFRQFRRRPAFSALGILTLALGIGATIGLFGAVSSILLRPLPVADEAALRVFWGDYNWRGVEFDYLRDKTRAFSALAAYSSDGATLRRDDGSKMLLTCVASAELFDVIGARPLMGRTFRAGEDRPGAEPVAVLTYQLWREDFGGDPDIVGRRIVLDGVPTTVIGVMPRTFFFPTPDTRLFTPLDLDPSSGEYQGNGWLVLLGRLKPGTSPQQIEADLGGMTRALGERFTYPAAWDLTKNASVRRLRDYLVGDVRPALLLLLGAGALILLMACANVAALILARTTDRSQEIVLRAALGAGRGRLARQIVAESVAFSLLASVVGLGIAGVGFPLLVASLPLRNGLGAAVALDWTALALAFGLSALVGLAVSVAPVRDVLRGRMQSVSGVRGAAGLARRTGRVHSALVGAESALAVLLVVGALLLIRSVSRLLAVDLGLDPTGIAVVDVVASSDVGDAARRVQVFREVEERAAKLPGVTSVGYTNRVPIRDLGWQGPVAVEGNPDLEGTTAPNALFRPVTPGYFPTLGIDIIQGRGIEAGDRPGTFRVGVVSRTFAERAWPGQNPIGRRLRTGAGGDTAAIHVVGVAEEVKNVSVTGANPFVLYVADAQRQVPSVAKVLLLRGSGNPERTLAAATRMISEVDPRLAVARPTTMTDVVSTALQEPIQLRFFLSLFAGLALVLGVVGIYSVVSYSVSRRQTELGLRMALGAAPGQVLKQVIGEGVAPVVMGTIAGVAGALLLARGATRFLYGVSPADPVSVVGAALALLGAGIAAAALPAARASRVSPVESLRAE